MDLLHYAEIHKTFLMFPPPQSSGVVALNDPLKTSVPAKHGQTAFRTTPRLFFKKENS